MRGFDLTPYRRSTVGFDRLFDLIENNARVSQGDNYPPFNIERLSDDKYRVTLAVAGFREDELDIVAQQNLLQVSGRKAELGNDERAKFVHVGIANRSFERRFELADFDQPDKMSKPALLHRRRDEAGEQRVRIERLALQLRVELHADEPRMIRPLDDLGQQPIGRHAREDQPALFQRLAIGGVHFVAVAVALADLGGAIDPATTAVAGRASRDRRRAASCRRGRRPSLRCCRPSLLIHSVMRPTTGSAWSRRIRWRRRWRSRPCCARLDAGHLHAQADAEEGHAAFARESGPRRSCPPTRARRKPPGTRMPCIGSSRAAMSLSRLLEQLGIDPAELHLHPVGDAAMRPAPRSATCRHRAGRHICRRRRSSLRLRGSHSDRRCRSQREAPAAAHPRCRRRGAPPRPALGMILQRAR
jgi:molecular chaperone IbpA